MSVTGSGASGLSQEPHHGREVSHNPCGRCFPSRRQVAEAVSPGEEMPGTICEGQAGGNQRRAQGPAPGSPLMLRSPLRE